jgi:hypothetical protein
MGKKNIKFTLMMVEELIFITMVGLKVLLSGDMNKKFRVELSSDLEYEEMVVYVSWNQHPFAVLNYEKGIESMELELLPLPKGESSLAIPFEDCMEVFQFAKETLIQSQKIS